MGGRFIVLYLLNLFSELILLFLVIRTELNG